MTINTATQFEELFDTDYAVGFGPEWTIPAWYPAPPDSYDFHVASGQLYAEVGWTSRSQNAVDGGFTSVSEYVEAYKENIPVLTEPHWVGTFRIRMQAPAASEINSFHLVLEGDGSGDPDYEGYASEYLILEAFGSGITGWPDFTGGPDFDGPNVFIVLADKDATSGWSALPLDFTWTNDWYFIEMDRRGGEGQRDTYVRLWKEGDPRPADPTLAARNDGTSFFGTTRMSFAAQAHWTSAVDDGPGTFVFEMGEALADARSSVFQPYGRDLHILSIRASFTDDNLYNHALVIASGDKDNIFYGEVRDDDPGSPTNIADIGDRVFKYESDLISTQAAADQAAMAVFLDHCLISEDVDMDNVCVPMLEGNDVIAVQELNFSELNQSFRIRSMTIPLANSRQVMKFGRVIAL